jgi:Predicted AAA-ATPase
MKKIGISDFEEVLIGDYYYVDKSLLIEDVRQRGKVTLIARPSRFGKTLNLSMLRYFYDFEQRSDNKKRKVTLTS